MRLNKGLTSQFTTPMSQGNFPVCPPPTVDMDLIKKACEAHLALDRIVLIVEMVGKGGL